MATATKEKLYDLWKLGLWAFAAAITLWFFIYLMIPPCFTGSDVFLYKDAAANLALGRGFVSRFNENGELAFFGSYPPLFPFICAFFFKLFGVIPKVNRIYDFLFAAIACLMFWFNIQPRFCNKEGLLPSIFILLTLLLAIPFGPFSVSHDRPENFTFILTLLSLMVVVPSFSPNRIFVAGIILGINFFISPFGFVLNFIISITLFLLYRHSDDPHKPIYNLGHVLKSGAMGAILPVIATVIILAWQDPHSINRFWDHASGKIIDGQGTLGYVAALISGDLNSYLKGFKRYTGVMQFTRVFYLIVASIATIVYLIRWSDAQSTTLKISFVTTILAMGFISIVIFPFQTNYMALAATLILVLFARGINLYSSTASTSAKWLIFPCLLLINLVTFPYIGRELVVAWRSEPSFYRMAKILDNIKKTTMLQPILVATSGQNYFLFKRNGYDVVPDFLLQDPQSRAKIDLYACPFDGSGDPFKPGYPNYWNSLEVELIYRPDLPQQAKLFGKPISHSSNTWEVELYRPILNTKISRQNVRKALK